MFELKSRIYQSWVEAGDRVLISDSENAWTGLELGEKINALVKVIEKNSAAGAQVGIAFSNSAVQALSILAVLSAQRIPVIFNLSDLSSAPSQWIARTNISLMLGALGSEATFAPYVSCLSLSRAGLVQNLQTTPRFVELHDTVGTALILFTSGSSGQPKAIQVPEEGLLSTIDFLIPYFELNEKSIAPVLLPICHSMALNTQFLPTFLAGGRSHLIHSQFEINRLYRSILDQNGSFVALIGETLLMCSEEQRRKNLPKALQVKHLQLAGGLITLRHLQIAKDLFPNAVLHKGYGLTEAIRVTMINSHDEKFRSASVGHALPFVEIEIRDNQTLIQEPFQIGEIFVKGPNVMVNAATTLAASIDVLGFMATGDVGYWNESKQLCISGRYDGLFKINGHRVSSFEIERMAIETSDLIRQAKCLAIEDARRGGHKLVLLLEIPLDLQNGFLNFEFQNLQEAMYQNLRMLPHFPKEIAVLEKFPRTSNGKLAVAELSNIYLNSKKAVACENPNSNLQFFTIAAA